MGGDQPLSTCRSSERKGNLRFDIRQADNSRGRFEQGSARCDDCPKCSRGAQSKIKSCSKGPWVTSPDTFSQDLL